MFIKLKIFLKILRFEIGIKGLLFLIFVTLLFGVGEEYEKFYSTSVLPGIIFLIFIFEFKKNNKYFFQEFLYLPNTIFYLKIFSILWAFIFSAYILFVYLLFHHTVSFEIFYVIFQVLFLTYFIASLLLIRSFFMMIGLILIVLSSIIFIHEVSLFFNIGIMLLSFFLNSNITSTSFLSPKTKINNSSHSKFIEYKINQSNYIIKFLIVTIKRNDVHNNVIKSLLILFIFFLSFIILIIKRDKNFSFFYFIIFLLPIIPLIIVTYSNILCKNIHHQIQFTGNVQDIFSQLSKKFFASFYILLAGIVLTTFFITGKTFLHLEMFYSLISLILYAHYSFSILLHLTDKYIFNFVMILVLGLIISLLPSLYKLVFSIILFILIKIYFQKKIKEFDYA